MQIFNKSILNPAFFLIFITSIIILLLLAYLQGKTALILSFWLFISAMIIYLVGSIGINFFGIAPMNSDLEGLYLIHLTNEKCYNFRNAFERRWNILNLVRTVFSLISFVLLLIPLFMKTGK